MIHKKKFYQYENISYLNHPFNLADFVNDEKNFDDCLRRIENLINISNEKDKELLIRQYN